MDEATAFMSASLLRAAADLWKSYTEYQNGANQKGKNVRGPKFELTMIKNYIGLSNSLPENYCRSPRAISPTRDRGPFEDFA